MSFFRNKGIIILGCLLAYLPIIGAKAVKVPPVKAKSLKAIYSRGKIQLEPGLKITLDTIPEHIRTKRLSNLFQFNDRLYIIDTEMNNLKMLDTTGRFIKVFGVEGKGPGDLYLPYFPVMSLERIIVYEIGNSRFSYFNPAGKFIKTENPTLKGRINGIDSLEDGRIIVWTNRSVSDVDKKETHEVSELHLFSSEMKYLKQLYSQEEHNFKYFMEEGEPRRIIKPFSVSLHWAKLPGNKIVVGFPDKYEFKIINVDTGVSKTINRLFKKEKLTSTDKSEYLIDRENKSKYQPDAASSIKFFKKYCEFPEYRPQYSKILTDSEGNILVLFYEKGPKGNITFDPHHFFDAFDAEGNFLSHVQIMNKKGFNPVFAVDSDAFWCSERDDDEESYWIKYKITSDEKK